jgi:DNA-binding CsgD family transcriptional regulator
MILSPAPHVMAALRRLTKISQAQTVMEAERSLIDALRPFGIMYYAAWIAADPEHVDCHSTLLSNWPPDWLNSYLEEKKYLYDPVVLRATSDAGSFFWHELDGVPSTRALELKRDAKHHGMIDGFTVSLRSSLPTATILSLAGAVLSWKELERQTVSAIADGFILRTMYLRSQSGDNAAAKLSPQERRILYLAAAGRSDEYIARELAIHRGTVLSHWRRIRLKLGASDRAQAVAIGIRSGELAF